MATESGPNPAPPTQALIVDSNATSRSILVGQLREYGVTRIVQCSRVQDARSRLEHTVFDYVLCDQFFGESNYSGQTLLDDLRRAQLLPFSTVFFMVTAEGDSSQCTMVGPWLPQTASASVWPTCSMRPATRARASLTASSRDSEARPSFSAAGPRS